MISIDHRHHHLAAIRSALSVMIYPVQYAVNAPIQLFTKVSGSLSTHQALARENEQLRLDNFALRSRAQKYNALARENQRLRELLDSSSELNETVVGADVLAIDTAPASRQIVINKGARHGVSVGQPVVDAHGVLGQIIQANPFSSTALLITDVSHAIPVQINRTGLRAISIGMHAADTLSLSFVPTNADIKTGDLVVTSGLGQRFPAGYPVGEVSAVEIDHGEPFARVEITPSAQTSRVREVLLVWPDEVAAANTERLSAIDREAPQ